MNVTRYTTKKITYLAVLVALQVVMSNLVHISFEWKQFNFGFLPIAAAAVLMGPVAAMIVGGLGDIVACILFPLGPYFPGFTLSNMLAGLIYGALLMRRENNRIAEYLPNEDQELMVRAVLARLAVGVTAPQLHSLRPMLLYGKKTSWMWMSSRIASNLIEIPVGAVLIYLLCKLLLRLPRHLRLDELRPRHHQTAKSAVQEEDTQKQ